LLIRQNVAGIRDSEMFNTVSDIVSLVKTIPTVTSADYFRFMMSGVRHEPTAVPIIGLEEGAMEFMLLFAAAGFPVAMGHYDSAETILRNTIQKQQNYWPAHMELANLLIAIGRTEEAIPYYERINQLLPESGIASNNLGGAFYFIGRFTEAIETWQQSNLYKKRQK
jgi:tetratricopeptide (TPR) repeat protein